MTERIEPRPGRGVRGGGGEGRPGRGRALGLALALLALLAVGALAGLGLFWAQPGDSPMDKAAALALGFRAAELAAPGGDAAPVAFEVAPGESLAAVAARLEAAGLIRDAEAFRLLARVRGLDTGIEAGGHTLRRDMPAEAVLSDLQRGVGQGLRLTLPEGRRAEEVAAQLAEAGLVDRGAFLTLVGQGLAAGPAVADRPPGTGLEGYLFPDTYEFPPAAGAEAVLARLLENFERRLSPELRAKVPASGLSLYEVVTLASIVERETGTASERPKVARVYLNRLQTPPYLLNADPTVQYGLGYQPESGSWWKRPLLYADLEADSAYNSYVNPGLPPGPIASPGLASIEAVLAPAEGPWQFFVANEQTCDGTHVFAETYEEHLANIEKYQTGGCGS